MNIIYSILIIFLVLISNIFCSNLKRNLDTIYSLDLNRSNWVYNSTNGLYYQIGVVYCTNPVNTTYQSMAIYVPEEYLVCSKNSEKYTCSIYPRGERGSYNATNAPIVMPVNTPGYASMKAPTSYSYDTVSNYTSRGIIYVYAGCRGRYEGGESYTAGGPWPVTDLKSAIRYLRYNSKLIPGDLNKIYTFGMSGGGAQSCLIGITGNSALFNDYLNANGAAMTDSDGKEIKDNVKGSQCWCPITNLDIADSGYEWNMGQYFSNGTRSSGTFTKKLSDDLTQKYVEYVNNIKLKDPNGNTLTLTGTNTGSYYDYLKTILEESLNNFITDTSFPYTPATTSEFPRGPEGGNFPQRNLETYNTIEDYIQSLNSDKTWINYDSSTKKASISSVGDFVTHCKYSSKSVGAFDDLNRTQAENKVFGIDGTTYAKHFDEIMANLLSSNKDSYSQLKNWDDSYVNDYTNDLNAQDRVSKTIKERVNMYNPMYYISDYYDGYRKSTVADYFRINTGVFQTDTGNVVEMNLYLALLNYGKNVDFTTVWEQKHIKAERNGGENVAERNFISWINKIEGVSDEDYDDNDRVEFKGLKDVFRNYSKNIKLNILFFAMYLIMLL